MLTFYKVAALWAGQEGSLLFWTWLLSIYSALAVLLNRKKNRQLMPYVVAVLMGTGVFFSSLVLFVANPFQDYRSPRPLGCNPSPRRMATG